MYIYLHSQILYGAQMGIYYKKAALKLVQITFLRIILAAPIETANAQDGLETEYLSQAEKIFSKA